MKQLTRKEQQARTRERLMHSAAKLFCRRGLEQASVDEISREAGYTKGAFYSNFASKEELFLALLDRKFGEEIERIEQNLRADSSPAEAARRAGEDFIRFLRTDPEWVRLYLEFVAHATRDQDFREELLTRLRSLDERLEQVYGQWSESLGIVPPLPLGDITKMITMMTDGFLMHEQLDPELREELIGTMLATFTLGLRELWRMQDPEAVRAAEERFARETAP